MSTFLVNLLLGLGYNAFVVSGYASREITFCNQQMLPCPYLPKPEEPPPPEPPVVHTKYRPTSPPNFQSQYLEGIERKKRERREQEIRERDEERERLIIELERPPSDRLFGQRVHSWVLILPQPPQIESSKNTADITEPMFIEPSTAEIYFPSDPANKNQYLGIESLWNDKNYWINMQRCTEACSTLNWDLGNVEFWEHLLPGEPRYMRQVEIDEDAEPDEEAEARIDFHMTMPPSYLSRIIIPFKDYEQRYPGGKKTVCYKKYVVEHFAPYSRVNGIVRSITRYDDYDYNEPIYVYETYMHRGDKLVYSEKNLRKELCTDYYDKDRPDACKSHSYCLAGKDLADEDRTIEYHEGKKMDELMRIRMHPLYMFIEYRDKRPDHLISQYVEYSPFADINVQNDVHYRPVVKIVEKFSRDLSLPPGQDVAMREFDFLENEIVLTYHFCPGEYTQAKRFFTKPPVTERGDNLIYTPDMTSFYNPDPMVSPENWEDLIDLLEIQLAAEDATVVLIRNYETLILNFLQTRSQEFLRPPMEVSRFNPIRNEEARLGLIAMEEQKRAASVRETEITIDHLSPYLARLGNLKYLTKTQAEQVQQDVINDFKEFLVQRANRVLRQYEKSNQDLAKIQVTLSKSEGLTKEEKERYLEKANKMSLKIHALDVQLNRIRDSAPKKYETILQFLETSPQLSILYNK